jgi:hypothetical protein
MSAPIVTGTLPRSFWIISIAALVWNLLGVASYLMTVTISPAALDAMPEAERALYQNIPIWVTSSYAIAVFGGTLASILLLMRKSWATTAFVVSLLAILLQMGHAFFMTTMLAVRGAAGAALPLCVIAVAIYLVWYSSAAKKKGWLS